jgi:hypothetical protein
LYLPDPTPGSRVETRFEPDATGTLMTMRMTLPVRDAGGNACDRHGTRNGSELRQLRAMIWAGSHTLRIWRSIMLATPEVSTDVKRPPSSASPFRVADDQVFSPAVGELMAALAAQGWSLSEPSSRTI